MGDAKAMGTGHTGEAQSIRKEETKMGNLQNLQIDQQAQSLLETTSNQTQFTS